MIRGDDEALARQQPDMEAVAACYPLLGTRIALGPLRHDLIPLYARWSNDSAVTRTMGGPSPVALERLATDFARLASDESSVNFTIYDRATGEPIGNTAWIAIDRRAGTAELVLYIGEAAYRGRGLGGETTQLMLAYAFDSLGLHNVMLRVYDFNLAGQRAYLRAGFREFGRRRQAKTLRGQFWDVVYMECLATEWARMPPHDAGGRATLADDPIGRG